MLIICIHTYVPHKQSLSRGHVDVWREEGFKAIFNHETDIRIRSDFVFFLCFPGTALEDLKAVFRFFSTFCFAYTMGN